MLISATELRAILDDPLLTLVDCRFDLSNPNAGRQAYEAGHIPGAYYLDLNQDLSAPVTKHGGRHPLPGIRTFEQTLRTIGAGTDSEFVLYDSSRGAYACRLWWMLSRAGIDKVRILNGGYSAWLAAGFTLEQGAESEPMVGNIRLSAQFDDLWTREQLLAVKPTLVDSREAARYRGEMEPIDPVAGHIPGAHNLPWQTATDEQGRFLAPDAQTKRWRDAGIDFNTCTPVVYCGSGVTACVNSFSAALAGKHTQLYSGSWSDWCSHLSSDNRTELVATQTQG